MDGVAEILSEMNKLVQEYVRCWESRENRFVNQGLPTGITNPNNVFANNLTDCETKYLLFIKEEKNQLIWRYRIEELPYEVVIHLPSLLTTELKSQSYNYDHKVLWSWIAQLFHEPHANAPIRDQEFLKNFILLVRLELSSVGKPPTDESVWKLNQIIDVVVSWHVREVLSQNYILALAFSFPVLERLLRILCSRFVGLDGIVINDFEIRVPDEKNAKYKKGNRISSLRDLLYLYEQKVAEEDQKQLLNEFKKALLDIFPEEKDAYDLIYEWRNNMLHGMEMHRTYHAVILNLISLILLSLLRSSYDELKERAKQLIRFNAESSRFFSSPWSFYPPEIF